MIVLVLNVDGVEASTNFTDVDKNAYYYDAVMELTEANIINGYPDGKFGPQDKLTREQAILLFKRALELDVPLDYKEMASEFKDVGTDHKYAGDVIAVYNKGIFVGSPDGVMGMKDELTREQMASVIVRAFELKEEDNITLVKAGDIKDFNSIQNIIVIPF